MPDNLLDRAEARFGGVSESPVSDPLLDRASSRFGGLDDEPAADPLLARASMRFEAPPKPAAWRQEYGVPQGEERRRQNVAALRRQGQQQREDIAAEAAQMGTFRRNIGAPLQQAGASLGSLATRPFNTKLADELNRYGERIGAAREASAEREAWWSPGSVAVGDAVRSLPVMLGGAAVGGPAGAIGAAATESTNQGLTEATDAGLTGWQRLAHAGTQGAIEGAVAGAFQAIPGAKAGVKGALGGAERLAANLVGKGAKGAVDAGGKAALKQAAKDLGVELAEEEITSFAQYLAGQGFGVNEPLTLDTAKELFVRTGLATGATVGGLQLAQQGGNAIEAWRGPKNTGKVAAGTPGQESGAFTGDETMRAAAQQFKDDHPDAPVTFNGEPVRQTGVFDVEAEVVDRGLEPPEAFIAPEAEPPIGPAPAVVSSPAPTRRPSRRQSAEAAFPVQQKVPSSVQVPVPAASGWQARKDEFSRLVSEEVDAGLSRSRAEAAVRARLGMGPQDIAVPPHAMGIQEEAPVPPLPPAVEALTQEYIAQGLPQDEAIRQAEFDAEAGIAPAAPREDVAPVEPPAPKRPKRGKKAPAEPVAEPEPVEAVNAASRPTRESFQREIEAAATQVGHCPEQIRAYKDWFDLRATAWAADRRAAGQPATPEEYYAAHAPRVRAGGQPGSGALYQIPAYHGTDTEFDAFSNEFIGQGEGAQAFGYGHYAASREALGKEYAKNVSRKKGSDKGFLYKLDLYGSREPNLLQWDANVEPTQAKAAWQALVDVGAPVEAMRGILDYDAWENTSHPSLKVMLRDILETIDAEPSVLFGPEDASAIRREYKLFRRAAKRGVPVEEYGRFKDMQRAANDAGPGFGALWRAAVLRRRPTGTTLLELVQDGRSFLDESFAPELDKIANDMRAVEGFFNEAFTEWESENLKENSGARFVRALEYFADSPKAASEALRKNGFDGTRYLDRRSRGGRGEPAYNYVIFDDSDIKIEAKERLFQGGAKAPKGAVEFKGGLPPVLYLFKGSDPSTIIHETGHLWTSELPPQEQAILGRWAHQDGAWGPKGQWTTEAKERLATGFEDYVMGKADPGLPRAIRALFARFKAWLGAIYAGIKYGRVTDIAVSPEVARVFDRMLGLPDSRGATPPPVAQGVAPTGTQEAPAPEFSKRDAVRIAKLSRDYQKQGVAPEQARQLATIDVRNEAKRGLAEKAKAEADRVAAQLERREAAAQARREPPVEAQRLRFGAGDRSLGDGGATQNVPTDIRDVFVTGVRDFGLEGKVRAVPWSGRFPLKAKAFYDRFRNFIGFREADARQVAGLSEEIAHYITAKRNGWDVTNPDLPELPSAFDYDAGHPSRRDAKLAADERFSGWFSDLLIVPDAARAVAPEYAKAFDAWLAENPKIARAVENMQRNIEMFRTQSYDAKWRSLVASADEPPKVLGQTLAGRVSFAAQSMLDWMQRAFFQQYKDVVQIQRAQEEAARLEGRELAPGEGAHDVVRNAQTARAQASSALSNGVFNPVTKELIRNKDGEAISLKYALEGIEEGRVEEFGAWLAAKQAIKELTRTKKTRSGKKVAAPRDPGMSLDEAKFIYSKEADNPIWQRAAARVTEYGNALIEAGVQVGQIAEATRDRITTMMPEWAPMYRVEQSWVMGQLARLTGMGGSKADKGRAAIFTRKGSSAKVLNPILGLVLATQQRYQSMNEFVMWKKLGEIAQTTPGIGHLIQRAKEPTPPVANNVLEMVSEWANAQLGKGDAPLRFPSPDAYEKNPASLERALEKAERLLTGTSIDPTILDEAVRLAYDDPDSAMQMLQSMAPERWTGGKRLPLIRVHGAATPQSAFADLADALNEFREKGELPLKPPSPEDFDANPTLVSQFIAQATRVADRAEKAAQKASARVARIMAKEDPLQSSAAEQRAVREAKKTADAAQRAADLLSRVAAMSPEEVAAELAKVKSDGITEYQLSPALFETMTKGNATPAFLRGWSKLTNFQKLFITGASPGFAAVEVFRNAQVYAFQRKHAPGIEDLIRAHFKGVPKDQRPTARDLAHTYLDPAYWAYKYTVTKLAPTIRRGLKALGANEATIAGIKEDPVVQRVLAEGGEIGTYLGGDTSSARQLVADVTGDRSFIRSQDLPRRAAAGASRFLEFVKMFGQASDIAFRLSEEMAFLRKQGYSKEDVAAGRVLPGDSIGSKLAARDVGVDFLRQGWLVSRYLSKIDPYTSAALAGTSQLAETAKRDLALFVIRGFLYGVLPTAAIWLAYKDKEHRKEEADWLKRYFVLYDADGNPRFRFAKAQGYQDFWSNGTMAILDALAGIDEKAASTFATNLVDAFLPPIVPRSVDELGRSISGLSDVIALVSNTKAFPKGAPIVPAGLEDLSPPMQYTDRTPAIYKWLGAQTGLSPMKMQYVVESATGGLAKSLVDPQKALPGRRFTFSGEYGKSQEAFDLLFKKADQDYKDARKRAEDARVAELKKIHGKSFNWYLQPELVAVQNSELPRDVYNNYVFTGAIRKLMTDIRKSAAHLSEDRDAKFEASERYLIGLARAATGAEPLARYPNPLEIPGDQLPETVRGIRDEWLGGYLYQLTNPDSVEALTNPDRVLRAEQALMLVSLAKNLPESEFAGALIDRALDSGSGTRSVADRIRRLQQRLPAK